MRRTVSDIFSDALACIISSAGGTECQNYTGPPYCRSVGSGRVRGAKYGADKWCATCIARHALETVHETGDEILRMEVPKGYRIVPDDPVQLTDAGHYVSTYCLHGLHGDSCRKTCKTCGASCRCWCHREGGTDV